MKRKEEKKERKRTPRRPRLKIPRNMTHPNSLTPFLKSISRARAASCAAAAAAARRLRQSNLHREGVRDERRGKSACRRTQRAYIAARAARTQRGLLQNLSDARALSTRALPLSTRAAFGVCAAFFFSSSLALSEPGPSGLGFFR